MREEALQTPFGEVFGREFAGLFGKCSPVVL